MWPMVGAFSIAFAWDLVGVWATRAFASQSVAALPLAAILMVFWIAGVHIAREKRYWLPLVGGAVGGAWGGIVWP